MDNERTITDAMLAAEIDAAGKNFDSHEIILAVARDNQQDYVHDLYRWVNSEAPFKRLHSQLGKRIKEICTIKGIPHVSTKASPDIFAQGSSCANYEK